MMTTRFLLILFLVVLASLTIIQKTQIGITSVIVIIMLVYIETISEYFLLKKFRKLK